MLTGEIRSQIDRIWDSFWTRGISNPLEVIEQITYLLFLRRLDELQTDGRPATANQIEFINMIVEHVAELGWMEPGLLYASPFIDINPKGVDGVFDSTQVNAIISTLHDIKQRAVA